MNLTDNLESKPKNKIGTFLKFVFFLGLGLFIIWLSLRNLTEEEKNSILHSFQIADYSWVILVMVLGIGSHILRSLRWILLMEPMGYKPSLKNTFYAVMVGYFANLAFPRLGEVTRCGILARYEQVPFNKSFGTVITERALDMVVFILLFFLAIFTQIGTIHNYLDKNIYPQLEGKFLSSVSNTSIILGFIGFLVFVLLLFLILRKKIIHSNVYHKVLHLVKGFWEGLKSLSQIKKPLLFIAYTVGIWSLYYFMLYLCFYCFPETSGLSLGAGLSALVLGSIGIMITPGGIGLYPAIIQETLLLYGIQNTTGLALGWITWSSQTLMILVVGGVSLLLLTFNKKAHDKA